MAIAWNYKVYVHGVFASTKEIGRLVQGETLLGWKGRSFQELGHRRWTPEDMALKPEIFLKDVDPEQQRFGWRSALDMWLGLDRQGLMDTGIEIQGVRERFLAERARYGVLPLLDDVPADMQAELVEMTWLDDDALLSIADATMSDENQRRLADLSGRDALAAGEQEELDTLRDSYGKVTLRKARALAVLSVRSGKRLLADTRAA